MRKLTLVTTATLATLIVGGTVVNAATYEDALHAKSEATIKFTKDTGKPDPENPGEVPDPENPGEIVTPPEENQNAGDLVITYASDLDFGTHEEGKSWEWFAKADKVQVTGEDNNKTDKYVTPFVSIKDFQGASRKGWTLTATLDENFTSTKSNELKGAELSYLNMTSTAPTGAQSPRTAPEVTTGEVKLTKGVAQPIAFGDTTKGYGKHSIALGSLQADEAGKISADSVTNGVKLTTTNKSQPLDEEYKTTITYELKAEPIKS